MEHALPLDITLESQRLRRKCKFGQWKAGPEHSVHETQIKLSD